MCWRVDPAWTYADPMHPPAAINNRLRSAFANLLDEVRRKPISASLAVLAAVSLLFLAAPRLDLAVSRWFYTEGSGFGGETAAAVLFVRELGAWIVRIVAAAAIAPFLFKLLRPERPMPIRPRLSVFLLTSLAIGPILIVNLVLKENWGRARPRQILDFGGAAPFTPVWRVSENCASNCSFVSGEAAAAFWLVALAFIVPPQYRRVVAAVTLSIAAMVSYTRIEMGGHFVSDVLIAWLLTLLVILVMREIVLREPPASFDLTIESGLARAGRAAWRRWRGPDRDGRS